MLQSHGVQYSFNEMIAIQTHDGLYDSANEKYLKVFMPEQKPRTSLPYILHQADLMAARIEFEREWLPKFKNPVPAQEKNFTLTKEAKKSTKDKHSHNLKVKVLKIYLISYDRNNYYKCIRGLVVVLGFTTFNLLKKNEKQEDILASYITYLDQFSRIVELSDEKLKKIDERGIFKSDDEIGFMYEQIKELQRVLSNFRVEKL